MAKATTKSIKRYRRHARIRARISGTAERPRLHVFRGLQHVYAQLIDDTTGTTIAGVHSKNLKAADVEDRSAKSAIAYTVGKKLAEEAKAKGISTIVFDRGGYAYHGRVQALADGARDGGLQF